MAYSLKRRIYEAAPDWLKRPIAWIPFARLAGPSYRRTMARHRWIDKADRGTLRAYQTAQLGAMLKFAVDQVPAYFTLKATVDRLPPFEALKAFPLLAKDDLQQDMQRYLPRDFERIPHYECATGGTTGNQMKFYVDDDSQSVEMAFMHRQWLRVGYAPTLRKATFRGVEFPRLRPGRYWQHNPVYNELQFSPYHLNADTAPLYWKVLRRYRPAFLHGYPSALSLLAEYVQQLELPLAGLKWRAALLGSEALFPDQREAIESALGLRAFSWYGHSERVILAGECEHTNAYHHFPDYGVLEIVGDDGETVSEPGDRGELVGTGLLNRSLPLIRYRTGDRARLLEPTCACGRSFDRFDEVEGRWLQEYVIGKGGSRISTAALNMHGPFFAKVLRYQYVQDSPGTMDLRLMVADDFTDADQAALLAAFQRKVGNELDITPIRVADIPLTSRGKLRRLIQNIPNDKPEPRP